MLNRSHDDQGQRVAEHAGADRPAAASAPTSGPDREQVAADAEVISHLLQAHGGGIEIVPGASPDVVRVRFTGLCTSCCLRPLTMSTVVEPVLYAINGVRRVEVEGMRVSDEALERLRAEV